MSISILLKLESIWAWAGWSRVYPVIFSFAAAIPQSCMRDVGRNAHRRPGVFMYDADA